MCVMIWSNDRLEKEAKEENPVLIVSIAHAIHYLDAIQMETFNNCRGENRYYFICVPVCKWP